jgi:hypothetical protein
MDAGVHIAVRSAVVLRAFAVDSIAARLVAYCLATGSGFGLSASEFR